MAFAFQSDAFQGTAFETAGSPAAFQGGAFQANAYQTPAAPTQITLTAQPGLLAITGMAASLTVVIPTLTPRASIAYENLADSAVVSASSSAVLLGPTRLQNPHIAKKWRGTRGSSESLFCRLSAPASIDTLAVMGLNLSSAATTRVRLSLTDPAVETGLVYDGPQRSGAVDPRYGYLVELLVAPLIARYARIDLAEAGISYVEAGRLFVGQRQTFGVNFATGWSRAWVDRSTKVESRGGQLYIGKSNHYRVLEMSFEWLTRAEREGFVEEIDSDIGQSSDVLMVTAENSSNLGRDSVWGLLDNLDPVAQPYSVDIFRKSYRIRERL